MNEKLRIKLTVPIDYLEDFKDMIKKEYNEIENENYISNFEIQSSEINGFDAGIVDSAKVLISSLGGGVGIAAMITAIATSIASFNKSKRGKVKIKSNNKDIILENLTVEEMIKLVDKINHEE